MNARTSEGGTENQRKSIGSRRQGAHSLRIVLACASTAATVFAVFPATAQDSDKESIEGVWRVTRQGVNCLTGQPVATFPAIMAFSKGGVFTAFGIPPGSMPALVSPEFGVWKREPGLRNYSFRMLSNNYDGSGTFRGTTEVTGQLTLENGFAYKSSIKIFDAAGQPQVSHCGQATGVRFE